MVAYISLEHFRHRLKRYRRVGGRKQVPQLLNGYVGVLAVIQRFKGEREEAALPCLLRLGKLVDGALVSTEQRKAAVERGDEHATK